MLSCRDALDNCRRRVDKTNTLIVEGLRPLHHKSAVRAVQGGHEYWGGGWVRLWLRRYRQPENGGWVVDSSVDFRQHLVETHRENANYKRWKRPSEGYLFGHTFASR